MPTSQPDLAATAVRTALSAAGLVAVAWLSAAGAARTRGIATRLGALDAPTADSLHRTTTPRGGGATLVLLSLLAVAGVAVAGLDAGFGPGWIIGGAAVAIVGGIDDLGSLSPISRLFVHGVAAFVLVDLAGLERAPPQLGPTALPAGAVAVAVLTVAIAFTTNAINFIDGIDGLAAGYTAVVATALWWLAGAGEAPLGFAIAALALAAACLGFLRWNWAPAHIFLGDVASGYLGFALAALALWGLHIGALSSAAVAVLLAPLYADTGWTLFFRAIGRRNVLRGHLDHAYQHAVRRGHSHAAVTAVVLAATAFVFTPLAAWAQAGASAIALAVAYGVASVVVVALRAGRALTPP